MAVIIECLPSKALSSNPSTTPAKKKKKNLKWIIKAPTPGVEKWEQKAEATKIRAEINGNESYDHIEN
jgi:hypothetical protein